MAIHREKAARGHSEKVAICEPGRTASGETSPADTLLWGIQTLYREKMPTVSAPSPWHSVGADPADDAASNQPTAPTSR